MSAHSLALGCSLCRHHVRHTTTLSCDLHDMSAPTLRCCLCRHIRKTMTAMLHIYCMVVYFQGFKFLWFGKLRQFCEFILSLHTYFNYLVIYLKFRYSVDKITPQNPQQLKNHKNYQSYSILLHILYS